MRYFNLKFLRKPEGRIDEEVSVSKKIKDNDMIAYNVIVDYATKTVLKCVIEGKNHDTTFDLMNAYYKKIYPKLIDQLEKEAVITARQNDKKFKG